jgi:hypothetical protein
MFDVTVAEFAVAVSFCSACRVELNAKGERPVARQPTVPQVKNKHMAMRELSCRTDIAIAFLEKVSNVNHGRGLLSYNESP